LPGSLDLLADFALDVWLMARYSEQLRGEPFDGEAWQRAIAGLLYRPAFTRRQGPGSVTLLGLTSASGVPHEIDGAADGWRGCFILECKTTAGGISKADAALFHFKVMDFYQLDLKTAGSERWWRFLCSTTPTPPAARGAATSLGLLICDPERLPLPVLVRAASQPAADIYLPETLLQEIVWLGERALCPLQERWRYRAGSGEISFQAAHWKNGEIQDLLWLEDELSGYLLDVYERHRPGALERRAMSLILQASKVA